MSDYGFLLGPSNIACLQTSVCSSVDITAFISHHIQLAESELAVTTLLPLKK